MSEMIWEEHAFVTPVMSTVSERMDPRQGKETILLVEDEEFIRGAVREALEAAGYRVVTAESADEARAVHSRFSEAVDLLLTDVVIPGRSGHELAADLLEGFPKLRVLLMRRVCGPALSSSKSGAIMAERDGMHSQTIFCGDVVGQGEGNP